MSTPQFLRFIIVGGVAAGANYGSRFLFSVWLSYELAIILAFLTGMLVAFVLMRRHVFAPRNNTLALQVVGFVSVNALALLQTLVISILLARWGLPALGIRDHAEALAHLAGVMAPMVTSYFGHKYWSFR